MKIYIGADHRGYKLKTEIKKWLMSRDVVDMGASSFDKSDDYTVYAERVASMVADNKEAMGILFCGSGVGVDVVANKFDGVRASLGKEPSQVKAGRSDDNMNVLVIASDFTKEEDVKNMVNVFLRTEFAGKPRHKRRLEEIEKIETNN